MLPSKNALGLCSFERTYRANVLLKEHIVQTFFQNNISCKCFFERTLYLFVLLKEQYLYLFFQKNILYICALDRTKLLPRIIVHSPNQDMHPLVQISERVLSHLDLSFKRYLFEKIDFASRLIIIRGARGVGKTILIQQYIREYADPDKAIWMSMDHIIFADQRLIDHVDTLYNEGYRIFALDEVHKYADWSREVKNIYDSYPDVHVLLTSSSALDIHTGMADLSRRADVYDLEGLSFREYMLLAHKIELPRLPLDKIMEDHIRLSSSISGEYDILRYFRTYLVSGYYPFFVESKKRYHEKLKSVINQVIEVDLPPIFQIDYNSIRQIKKLLALIARLVPYSPDISQLSRDVGIGRNRILQFLDYLDKAGLVHLLKSEKKSDSIMAKPDKIFLQNTNLIHALGLGLSNIGTIRETFVMNILSATQQVSTPAKGDFMINGNYVAEVGGQSKTFKQINDIPNSFLIKDSIAVGSQEVVPLWIFGLLY